MNLSKWELYENLYMKVWTMTNGLPYGAGRLEAQVHVGKHSNDLVLTDGFKILDYIANVELEDAMEEGQDILINLSK